MSHNGLVGPFVCRACRRKLAAPGSLSRTFSITAQRDSTIPSFSPTTNPELDTLLMTYRTKVFTPWALQAYHRDLMYKPSRHQILLNEPGVTVTLSNGEEVKLMPMDPHDKPNKKESLKKLRTILEQSSDAKDWDNIPAFLEGMKMAHEPLPEGWLEKLTRKANEQGRTGIMVKCAQMGKRTGLSLSEAAIGRELMLGCHMRAARAGWKGDEMEKAYKQAELLVLLMEDEQHCGGKLKDHQKDLRRDVGVVGVLLELTAVKAIHDDGGRDTLGKVRDYAAKAIFLCELDSMTPEPSAVGSQQWLEKFLPLWAGLKMALKVDDLQQSDIAPKIKGQLKRLDTMVQEAKLKVEDYAKGKKKRGLMMYDEVRDL